MKKLKTKVFTTIFSILTIFIFSVFIIINYRNYNAQKRDISSILNRPAIDIKFENKKDNNPRQIFLNYTVYTIILDDNDNFIDIINHTESDIDEEKIKTIASNIISNHKTQEYIGNLYLDKYSYVFSNNHTLIIVDNTNQNKELIKNLLTTFVLFISLEIIVYIIAHYLTKWIIEPVNESFEKQKRFIADASHELKTPIAVIMASLDAYLNDNNIKWINNIRNESERMNKLVTSLLDLAKLENEIDVIKKEENLSNIIESSILTFESLFYEQKIKLDYDISENIKFNCNSDQIKELMSILIDNAIKHSEEKGKVIIKLSTINNNIILEVKNKGLPIKDEELTKIFERFYRADSSRNRKDNNYGLGLAIAKNIVEKNNGTISASSKDNYTTFKIVWSQN